MFSLRQPSQAFLKRQLAKAQTLPLSYAAPFKTAGGRDNVVIPAGYVLDHTRTQIGNGSEAFNRAKAAMREWKHFDLGWVRIANPQVRVEIGELVAVEAHALTLWSINISRILYVIDEPNRFGYGYGTTELHVERGEERFLLDFDSESGAVHYDLLAISEPAHWLARLGYPYTRHQQHKFAIESHRKMRELCG